jgi:hypothetical protein
MNAIASSAFRDKLPTTHSGALSLLLKENPSAKIFSFCDRLLFFIALILDASDVTLRAYPTPNVY